MRKKKDCDVALVGKKNRISKTRKKDCDVALGEKKKTCGRRIKMNSRRNWYKSKPKGFRTIKIAGSEEVHPPKPKSREPSYLLLCLFMRSVYYCFSIHDLDRRVGTTLFVFTLDLLLTTWPSVVGFSLFIQIAREGLLFYYPKSSMTFEPENLLFTTLAFLISLMYCLKGKPKIN
jgi:hypothetical protein